MASPQALTSREPERARGERGRDRLYAHKRPTEDFRFDAQVADVFDDMVARSVPGYASLIHGIGVLGAQRMREHHACYDLGCSLGAVARRWARHKTPNSPIIAVDASRAMIERAAARSDPFITYQCADIRTLTLRPASVVALNLTLQFLPAEDRLGVLENIARALHPDGALILTEKIRFNEPEESLRNQQHEAFKRLQGYSELEISQKRTALERTLVRDSLEIHRARLKQAGFHSITVWFQCLHFCSMLAQRRSDSGF